MRATYLAAATIICTYVRLSIARMWTLYVAWLIDVIIGSPFDITREMIAMDALKINTIVTVEPCSMTALISDDFGNVFK